MTFKIAGFATAALLLSATLAFAEATLTPEVEQKIKDTLTAQGYEVGKIKIEDGLYEVYAKKGGGGKTSDLERHHEPLWCNPAGMRRTGADMHKPCPTGH